jgi:NhaP-type Na+/H+ or K+/H+ antiporter
MSFLHWMAVLGSLLLILTLASTYLRWMPVTTSAIYLAFGLGIGPWGLGIWRVDLQQIVGWLEHLTEVAVLVSLFVGGTKLRLAFRHTAWKSAYLLAGPVMLASIAGVTLVGHFVLGLDLGVAMLIGALLAPTDPVLASLVQVSDAQDVDRVRYGLSGEAGFNDGVAFPFVIFALLFIEHGDSTGGWLVEWVVLRVLWAVPAALLIGFYLGRGVGELAIYLRSRHADAALAPNDFLALALIALSYVFAESLGAWGFLAAFAAGVGLRHAEIATSSYAAVPAEACAASQEPNIAQTPPCGPAEAVPAATAQVTAGVVLREILSFGHILERSLEVLLVTLLGALLALHWDWRALPLGLALFCVIRPLSVWLLVRTRGVNARQRLLLGWFGIRGIGSLYYLSYALTHGLDPAAVDDSIGLTLSVVALSIVLHGLTTQPLLDRYERQQARRGKA